MVTVEADPVHVESRLAAGTIGCPACGDGVLGGWGYARARRIVGLGDRLRPRRARCRACAVTHVLLPVAVLLRRAYAAELIWAALTVRAEGCGHRRVAAAVGVPATTVRGWLRRMAERLEEVRSWFLGVAVVAGVDVTIPDTTGCRWRDLQCAVETATAAVRSRFGPAGFVGAVTPVRVAVTASGGRLLAPGWPSAAPRPDATPVAPDAGGDDR